jgi:hypothetical protein
MMLGWSTRRRCLWLGYDSPQLSLSLFAMMLCELLRFSTVNSFNLNLYTSGGHGIDVRFRRGRGFSPSGACISCLEIQYPEVKRPWRTLLVGRGLLYQLPLVMAPNTIFCGPCTSLFWVLWGIWVWVGIQEYLARAPSTTFHDPRCWFPVTINRKHLLYYERCAENSIWEILGIVSPIYMIPLDLKTWCRHPFHSALLVNAFLPVSLSHLGCLKG